jgi:hypothetical protein
MYEDCNLKYHVIYHCYYVECIFILDYLVKIIYYYKLVIT